MGTEEVIIRSVNDFDDEVVRWDQSPRFDFATEVDALEALQTLGDHLAGARREVEETMRYLRSAVRAARLNGEGLTSADAIIGHSGLSRRTVYKMLDEA